MSEKPTTKPAFTLADVGCFFDSHGGRYIGEAVIALALEHGWAPTEGAEYVADNVGTEHEHYCEFWDEAEQYLQTLCDDDVMFDNEDGFCLIRVIDSPHYCPDGSDDASA